MLKNKFFNMKFFLVVLLCLGAVLLGFTAAEECRRICPAIYSPLCGEDKHGGKRTFASNCEFELENCLKPDSYKLLHPGPC